MNFKTYEDLTKCIIKNLHKIPRDVDLIVGIPRSGTMVANILALYMNLPFTDINSFVNKYALKTGNTRKCSNWIQSVEDAKHVLIVDDSISSGRAINEAKELLLEKNVTVHVTFLAVYTLAASKNKVDIYFEKCEQPRMFEWNYMHHWALKYCCMDIDGVVCEDPKRNQNDDAEKYLDFLENAPPKFIPTQKVGMFVTTRLEKYRYQTEAWLNKYHITYDSLNMLKDTTAQERAVLGMHAEHKAKIYKNCNAILFFESDYGQALNICHLSGKPVFCVEERTLITSDNVIAKLKVYNMEFKVTVKRILRRMINKIGTYWGGVCSFPIGILGIKRVQYKNSSLMVKA